MPWSLLYWLTQSCSYVQSLLSQLESLKMGKDSSSVLSRFEPATATPIPVNEAENIQQPHVRGLVGASKESGPPSFDQHSFPNFNGGSSQFFGASSAVILTVHVLRFAIRNNVVEEAGIITPPSVPLSPNNLEMESHKLSSETPENIQAYVTTFIDTIGVLQVVVDIDTLMQQDLPSFITLCSLAARPEDLHGTQMHQYFCVSMICAIGCAANARHQPDLAVKSLAFFEDVLPCVEEVTSEVSFQSLQALLLLTIFCLFWPTKGDVWRLLDYCCRTSVELGCHAEPTDELENEAQQNLRRSMFWSLYTLEGLISQIFGRSPDLHDTIITAKYPDTATLIDGFAVALPQYPPVSFHYRLMHIRLDIFKTIYLPAEKASMNLDWYRDRFRTLQKWSADFNTLTAPDSLTALCTTHYHSTVCFLFQPLMLEAMALTSTSSDIRPPTIPQDNYWSACELVKAYESIVRARRDSLLGKYPMTFVSAQFIYLACMTIMCHCLLALTGHEKSWRMNETVDTYEPERIDFSGLLSISNSALVLLSWCSERWPDMQGMLDVYKKLADVIIPAIFRKGMT